MKPYVVTETSHWNKSLKQLINSRVEFWVGIPPRILRIKKWTANLKLCASSCLVPLLLLPLLLLAKAHYPLLVALQPLLVAWQRQERQEEKRVLGLKPTREATFALAEQGKRRRTTFALVGNSQQERQPLLLALQPLLVALQRQERQEERQEEQRLRDRYNCK